MELTNKDIERMRKQYVPRIARYIADAADRGEFLNYKDVSDVFGGVAQGQGDRLGGIAIFCMEHNLPLLPVIVVLKNKEKPSDGAILYRHYGITDVEAEQEACFAYDWSTADFEAS